MKLYHGSNVVVEKPRLLRSDRRLDFGAGFYLTSSFEQAKRWAVLTARRRETGSPLVSVFDFDEQMAKGLSVLEFSEASEEWLEFVGGNRSGKPERDGLDIVIGPVADDKTMPVLRFFFADVYTVEETIRRLLPQKLTDQYAFKTWAALDALIFCEVVEV